MTTDIDARLDLLSRLRDNGYGSADVKLTETGHDFIVCLDAMTKLLGPTADADDGLLRELVDAVHLAVHRGGVDKPLVDALTDIVKRAGLWPLEPPPGC